jgi:endonuclease/exonuclease/phosphatase family metal-dependent hydrolase
MRKIAAVLLCFLATGLMAQGPVELITYNIRLNTPGDGEHAWPYRKDDVTALFRFHRADIFCVQEALPGQMDDLESSFPGFA